MKSSVCICGGNRSALLRIVLSIATIAPLWLTPAMETFANAQTTSSPADWTQFHRDNMQRWNPYETVLGAGNVKGLKLKWNYPISAPTVNFLESSPAVVNGVVYVGSEDHYVYALNAATGAKLWSFLTGGQVESSPAVANGMVYVGSIDDNVYALNATTGAKLWSFTTGSVVESSPTVVNGVVYIGSDDGKVYALNATTGAQLWSFAAVNAVLSSPAVVNGVVYATANGGVLYALNATTGAKLWTFSSTGTMDGSPAVATGVVYIGSTEQPAGGTQFGRVYGLNASNGAKLWSFDTGQGIGSSPAVANGVVYVGSEDFNVYALNATTGAQLWSFATTGFVESSPAVADGVVYVGSNNGIEYALDAGTGTKLWSYQYSMNGMNASSSQSIVNGVLYVNSVNNLASTSNFYAFSLAPNAADLFLRIIPTPTIVHQGDLLTFAFPVWNLGPDVAEGEVLSSLQVPAGTTFDYLRISGTPGLGTCTHPPYGGTGQIICHEGDGMAPNTTWTVRLTVKVTAPAGTVITANAAAMSDTPDPNMAKQHCDRKPHRAVTQIVQ